jgi:hypothetical protein
MKRNPAKKLLRAQSSVGIYITASKKLVFRYDNTGHHKKLRLPTYPHHKHQGYEDNVILSTAPDLASVFDEIDSLVQLP